MAKLSILDMLRVQCWDRIPPVVKVDLSGKTVAITGANVGLGLEAAKHFASMSPARLILACRNKENGEKALEAIERATGCKTAELWPIDQGDFASVIAFADKFEQDGGGIDIFVANAGGFQKEYRMTSNGWEETIQTNHLSTALLSILIFPRLLQATSGGSPPRLVIVGSGVHFWAKFDQDVITAPNLLEKLSDKDYCTPRVMANRYNDSKLLNLLFARALASRLPQTCPVIVNCVDPGYCVTQLRRNHRFPAAQIDRLFEFILGHTSEQGSRQLVWGAVGCQGREEELKGAYLSAPDVLEPSDYVLGEEGRVIQDRVWDDTMEILSKISPKVLRIVEGLNKVSGCTC